MECVRQKRYPVNPEEYKLYEEIGEGVSATVYRALCIPFNEIVAIKVLDLEKCNNDFDGIRREVQTMTLIKHPNVLRAHCSFTADRSLWVVMPYMAGGSCLHIMKSAHPEGFEEPVIVTLLRDVLKALVYLHKEGHIHRDVKAGNILIDSDGAVKLADFGVSACMFDTGDRQRSRNTFVGTPCWMAPEVMQQLHGYDFKADVWSFGITALELAHGHAPFSKYPPMKVLLMTLQNAPPGLDYERDKRFSKSFKQMVGMCLVKDPKRRPTSEKLLKHSFFKGARSNEYLRRNILEGLAPLGDRFRKLKDKEADFLLENKVMSENKEHLSHQEYIRGISAWNFNLEDLKAQAALLDDNAEFSPREDLEMNNKSKNGFSNVDCKSDALHSKSVDNAVHATKEEDELLKIRSFEDSLASSFPTRPLLALNGYFDVYEDDTSTVSPEWKDATQSSSEPQQQLLQKEDLPSSDSHLNSESSFAQRSSPHGQQKFLSGSLLPERVLSPSGNASANGNRNGLRHSQSERNYSGPLVSRQIRETHHQQSTMMKDEASEERVIHKGRFKVTSADACPKGVPSTNISKPPPGAASTAKLALSSVLPSLQFILQQNAMQREQLTKLIQCVEQTSGRQSEYVDLGAGDTMQFSPASDRERELLANVVQLQQGISSLSEEIQRLRIQNAQIQRQLDDASDTES